MAERRSRTNYLFLAGVLFWALMFLRLLSNFSTSSQILHQRVDLKAATTDSTIRGGDLKNTGLPIHHLEASTLTPLVREKRGLSKVARGVARVLGLAGKGGWAAGRMEPARYFKKRIPIKPPSVKLIPGMKKPKHSATWVMGADNTGTNVRKIPFFNDRQAGKVARGGNSNQLKDNLLKKDVDKPKSNSPNKGKPDPKKTKKINPFKQILKKPITGLRKGAKGVKRGVRFPKVKKGFFPKLSALFKSLGAFVYVVIAVLVVLAVFLCKIFLCCLIAKLNAARRPRDRGIEMQYLIY